jgi:hypothetical protein
LCEYLDYIVRCHISLACVLLTHNYMEHAFCIAYCNSLAISFVSSLNYAPSAFSIGTTNIIMVQTLSLKDMVHFPMQEALKRKLKARMDYAKFLQETTKEMANEVQTSHSGEIKQTAEDLDEFLNKLLNALYEHCLMYLWRVA